METSGTCSLYRWRSWCPEGLNFSGSTLLVSFSDETLTPGFLTPSPVFHPLYYSASPINQAILCQQSFVKYLLCLRHCAKYYGYKRAKRQPLSYRRICVFTNFFFIFYILSCKVCSKFFPSFSFPSSPIEKASNTISITHIKSCKAHFHIRHVSKKDKSQKCKGYFENPLNLHSDFTRSLFGDE